MVRNTEIICPNCQEGTILDQRATVATQDMPYWICSSPSKNCNYREKYSKTWQWSSWEWQVPYFIEISEDQNQKKERIKYEKSISAKEDSKATAKEVKEKITENIKICRDCGKRDYKKINRCLSS